VIKNKILLVIQLFLSWLILIAYVYQKRIMYSDLPFVLGTFVNVALLNIVILVLSIFFYFRTKKMIFIISIIISIIYIIIFVILYLTDVIRPLF
jgi:hypothetical protein